MTPEWISAGANIILALGVSITAWQLIAARQQVDLLRRQIADDHERSRCSEAIRAISEWTRSLDKAQPSTRVLVNTFSIDQCQKLKQRVPFMIDACHAKLLEHILQGTLDENDLHRMSQSTTPILLNEKYLSHIYYLAAAHLNSLEVCLQHWVLGTADREVIESELRYLVNPERNEYVLENFRIALGGALAYPAIDAFVAHLKDKLTAPAPAPRSTLGQA